MRETTGGPAERGDVHEDKLFLQPEEKPLASLPA
jgi:hypothetical protein